jgi:hypothetical protein
MRRAAGDGLETSRQRARREAGDCHDFGVGVDFRVLARESGWFWWSGGITVWAGVKVGQVFGQADWFGSKRARGGRGFPSPSVSSATEPGTTMGCVPRLFF